MSTDRLSALAGSKTACPSLLLSEHHLHSQQPSYDDEYRQCLWQEGALRGRQQQKAAWGSYWLT